MSISAGKIIRRTILAIIIILVLAVIVAYFSLNSIVAGGIRTFGTKATGTKVEVQSVNISPFAGSLEIKGLCVANPKDYKSENAFALGRFHVNMDLKSIFSDKIIINEVLIDETAIDYEPSVSKGSNLQEINDNISAYTASEKTQDETPSQTAEKKAGKRVVIKYLLMQNGSITVSSSLLKNSIKVPMPKLEMRDIGEDGDKSASETFQEIYDQVLQGVGTSISGIEGINLDSLNIEGVSRTPENLGKSVNEGLKSLQSSIGL
jgi:hypothetical protein